MTVQKVAAFPDTNLFLHFRPLNEIDWCELLQASSVEIKIAPVVTRELEVQKTLNPSRKLRERADKALRLLHGYLRQNQVRNSVTLEFLITEPNAEAAVARGLNLQINDDRLVGTFLQYRDEHPDVPCVLVTDDLPLTVKATHYQIQIAPPGDPLRLPAEPDALEKKNQQLQAELLRYKSREPGLDVLFKSGQRHAQFQIQRPTDAASGTETTIQSRLSAAFAKCPLVELRPEHDPNVAAIKNNPFAEIAESIQKATAGLQAFGRQFYEDYNARARAYYRDYEKYLRDSVAFQTLASRTVELNLILANGGTCPAEDIHLLLHFPDGFTLYDEDHPIREPKEPSPPSKEMNLFPSVSLLHSFPDIRMPQPRDPSLPRIRKTNSYEVTLETENLQHGFVWTLTPLYATFDSWESAKSFSIDYTIHAGNMIDDQTGELGVAIKRT
jgi:PIN domain